MECDQQAYEHQLDVLGSAIDSLDVTVGHAVDLLAFMLGDTLSMMTEGAYDKELADEISKDVVAAYKIGCASRGYNEVTH